MPSVFLDPFFQSQFVIRLKAEKMCCGEVLLERMVHECIAVRGSQEHSNIYDFLQHALPVPSPPVVCKFSDLRPRNRATAFGDQRVANLTKKVFLFGYTEPVIVGLLPATLAALSLQVQIRKALE